MNTSSTGSENEMEKKLGLFECGEFTPGEIEVERGK